jgi:hypothetical protein
VIRTRFDCPETGESLSSTVNAGQWPGRDDELVSMHCPKCSKLHSFGLQAPDATGAGEHVPDAAGAALA